MFRLRPKPSREPLVVESSSAFEHFFRLRFAERLEHVDDPASESIAAREQNTPPGTGVVHQEELGRKEINERDRGCATIGSAICG